MIAICMTGLGTILLLLVPFIPGLRGVPLPIPVHRLVWRSWYRSVPESGSGASQVGATTGGKSQT